MISSENIPRIHFPCHIIQTTVVPVRNDRTGMESIKRKISYNLIF